MDVGTRVVWGGVASMVCVSVSRTLRGRRVGCGGWLGVGGGWGRVGVTSSCAGVAW